MGVAASSPEPVRVAAPEVADPISAMTPRFNFFFRWFARRWFREFDLDDATVARLKALESRGSVVYVMRYASRLDYFLLNTLLAREGLRLSGFANGIRFYYYRPVFDALRAFFAGRRWEREGHGDPDRERARAVVDAGESMFLFLRTARLRNWLRGRRAAVEQGRQELDLLAETVRVVWNRQKPVHVVPIALFWRKGPRSNRRFLNLSYGAATRPSDFAKVSSFLISYHDLAIHVGDAIDLAGFVAERRHEGQRALVRKIRRAILLFLYREERAVEGPTLRPRHKVQEVVLGHPEVAAAIEARAGERGGSIEAARVEAEKIFREIAANMNSPFFAIINVVVTSIFRRMFVSIDATGLEKVADYAKQHPVVLVPSHRSYFDFLILSWLFYHSYLVPPHIAARENMGFGPFGFIFRRVGAFFLRRSFDDPLYKEIFRQYLCYLVKEGFTQEFFIEGGRSRTGKTLTPRLGMVAWNVEAFARSGRQDLFIVPIAITYERLVEEGAMVDELEGGAKQSESTLGLLRARKFLQRRFGSVHVNCGEPISLGDVLADRRELFLSEGSEEDAARRRRLVEELGNRVVERINWAMVANATSVAACALLGEPRRGMFRAELTARMREVMDLLRLQDVRMTPALLADEGEFEESIASLLRDQIIARAEDPRGEILYFEESRRRSLDVYRNVILHFLFAPSVMARRLLRGVRVVELREDVGFWLDFFYPEFFAPRGIVLATHFDALLDYFERIGVLERRDDRLEATEKGRGYFAFLAEQTRSLLESYYVTFSGVLNAEDGLTAKQLEKAVREHFERTRLLGEIQRREAWNPVTFRNALDLLARRGVLELESGGEDSRRDRRYRRGPAEGELSALRERLAAALGGL